MPKKPLFHEDSDDERARRRVEAAQRSRAEENLAARTENARKTAIAMGGPGRVDKHRGTKVTYLPEPLPSSSVFKRTTYSPWRRG